jgi:hypothetical protein
MADNPACGARLSAYDHDAAITAAYERVNAAYDATCDAYNALMDYAFDHWIGWALGFRAGRRLREAHHAACAAHHDAIRVYNATVYDDTP